MTVPATQKFTLNKDKIDLYLDFVINLINYITKYYIDKESLSSEIDIKHHYNFCYNKVIDDFKEEGIDFSKNEELKKYFYKYFYEQLYIIDTFNTDKELPLNSYIKFWKSIFNVGKKSNFSMLAEVYILFEKTFII
jgi:hypothetical protein